VKLFAINSVVLSVGDRQLRLVALKRRFWYPSMPIQGVEATDVIRKRIA